MRVSELMSNCGKAAPAFFIGLVFILLSFSGCKPGPQGAPPARVPQVGYVTVRPEAAALHFVLQRFGPRSAALS